MANIKDIVDNMHTDTMFFQHNILNKRPWKKQRQIINRVMNLDGKYERRTAVRSCHGIGKSTVAGMIALQFLYTFQPSIVITTAPTFRQVEKAIWKEIRDSYNFAKVPLGGKLQAGAPNLQIVKDNWYCTGISTNEGDKFQGIHSEHILIIVDEAAGISESIYNSIEGLMTSKNAHLLLLGNPTSVTGTFKKAFETPGWNKVKVSAFDTPNFTHYGITIDDIRSGDWKYMMEAEDNYLPIPGLITPEWVAFQHKSWGENSIFWRTRVLGEFDEEGSDGVIPLSWLEASFERYEMMVETGYSSGIKEIGVDVAEYGRDTSVIYVKEGNKIHPAKTYNKMPIMELTGHVVKEANKHSAKIVKVDTIGVGTGVEGRLTELGINAARVNVGETPGGNYEEEKNKFINKRAQFYWSLREQLDPSNPDAIGIQRDDDLLEELMATKYKINSSGKIQIISKDDIKKMIGRSPDKSDALMIACAPENLLERETIILKAGTWG